MSKKYPLLVGMAFLSQYKTYMKAFKLSSGFKEGVSSLKKAKKTKKRKKSK